MSKRAKRYHASSSTLIRRLARDQLRPHVWTLVQAVVAMIVVSASTAGNAWMMQPALDEVFLRRDQQMLYLIPAAVLLLALIKGVASYFEEVTMTRISQRIVAETQNRMFAHLMRADIAFFHANPTGTLLTRFTVDVQQLRGALAKSLTGMVKDAMTLIFLVGLMFWQDPLLAAAAFFVFPASVLPIVRLGKRIRKVSANTQAQYGELTTVLEQTFQGARHVKAYGMEAYEAKRVAGLVEAIFRLIMKATRVRGLNRPVMETLGGAAVAIVILYGGSRVISGATTPGTFFSFVTALLLAYQPLKSIANFNATLQEGLASAQRIFDLFDVEPEIRDRPGARDLGKAQGRIAFENVSFSYGPEAPALHDVSFEVAAGSTVALVGPSGAGKSTILNLIPRFYDPSAGRITIDGIDVRDVTLASLRANTALVSQEIALFDDTVRANIAYGRPGASEAEIEEAARNAAAHEFIGQLPQGYDTRVGEQGVKLSGGQRQRIAIARAMLKNAPILLLDEATSALDTESERQIQQALTRLMAGRTTIVIAHRLSTVSNADVIHAVERGRLVESGPHAELIARGGLYARLYALQFADRREPAVAAG